MYSGRGASRDILYGNDGDDVLSGGAGGTSSTQTMATTDESTNSLAAFQPPIAQNPGPDDTPNFRTCLRVQPAAAGPADLERNPDLATEVDTTGTQSGAVSGKVVDVDGAHKAFLVRQRQGLGQERT